MKSIRTLFTITCLSASLGAAAQSSQGPLIYPTEPIEPQALFTPAQQATVAAVADGVTTLGALAGGAIERNPIMPVSPLGIVAITAAKVGLTRWADTLPDEQRASTLTSFRSFFGGAAVNNLLVMASAANPVSIAGGLIAGVYFWNDSKQAFKAEAVAKAQAKERALALGSKPEIHPRQVALVVAMATPQE